MSWFVIACSSPNKTTDGNSDASECVDLCSEDTTQCDGDSVTSCERDAAGCLVWSTPVSCSFDEPYCSLGNCLPGCVDECALGEERCDGSTVVRTCGDNDADSCLDWLEGTPCPESQVCSNGQCSEVCADECQADEVKCFGTGTSSCEDSDSDGCMEWGPETSCEEGYSCTNGVCEEQCDDECSAAACNGDSYYDCGNYDLDSCLDQSAGTSCASGNDCLIGSCTSTGCVTEPFVCDTLQPAQCISSTKLRTYEASGICVSGSGGRCVYSYDDTVCLEGCLLGSCAQSCESEAWLSFTVESVGVVGAHSSVAANSSGAYISYYDASNRDLKLSYRTRAGLVSTETIDSTGDVGKYTSMKMDAEGGLHIAYYDVSNEDLKYAYRSPEGVITTQTLDWPGDVGRYASLALDSDGGVHVGYLSDGTTEALKYAYRSPAGDVSVSEIDSAGSVGYYSSIDVDSLGGVHFSYSRITYGRLRYAYRDPAGNVTTSNVDGFGSAGRYSSIGVDSAGAVHIGYSTGAQGGVRYARISVAGVISIAELESSGVYDQHVSLHVEADDDIHISYFDGSLRYAYLAAPNNPPVYARVEPGAGRFSSIDTDDMGGVHISFHDESDGDLKYAYRCP